MIKFYNLKNIFAIGALLLMGCHPTYFLRPTMQDSEIKYNKEIATIKYQHITDSRPENEKKSEEEKACLSSTGVSHVADDWYKSYGHINKNVFVSTFDDHLVKTLKNSNALQLISDSAGVDSSDYRFTSNLETSILTYDASKATQTQACIGGLIGALVASGMEVTTNTQIVITGKLTKNGKEVWSHKVNFNRDIKDKYANGRRCVERSINEAIGESCGELTDELVKYFDKDKAGL